MIRFGMFSIYFNLAYKNTAYTIKRKAKKLFILCAKKYDGQKTLKSIKVTKDCGVPKLLALN